MNEFMSLRGLQELPLFQLIAESSWIFPALESFHVVAIGLVVGSILFVDLRLLGIIWRRDGVADVAAALLPATWVGFGFAVVTGVLMFASSAIRYSGNPAFLAKLTLLLLAGINMLIFHRFTYAKVDDWGKKILAPVGARVAALLSVTLWIGILILGRWIGFI